MKLWLLVLGCLLLVLTEANGVTFTEFQLYVVRPETIEQLEKLHEIQEDVGYDFWDVPRLKRGSRVMVSHMDEIKFEEFLERNNIDFDPVVENVQQILDKERMINTDFYKRAKRDSAVDFNHYWTLEEIYAYIEELSSSNPMVTTFDIGTTPEGRPIKALSISSNGQVNLNRPVVFMDSGIHAREWAGIMSVMYMIHEFVEQPDLYSAQLSNTDYVIIPVLNPDGYVYTHEVNRLWRKNRVQSNILCAGVDLNRNYPYAWAFTSNPCTNTFAGTGPGSELESRAMMELMEQYKSAMTMYIAVHTHGEMILWPWGYDFVHCENSEEHDKLGKQARDAIVSVGGDEWEVGNSADILYKASGATDDYAYDKGARLAYTIELTGGGLEGFDLPPSQLDKVVKETMEIYKTFGSYAGTLPLPGPTQ